jgi:hypothetical protein
MILTVDIWFLSATCLTNTQAKSFRKKQKSGKKKHKNSAGRQNLRSTSRRSKRGGHKQANAAPHSSDKNLIQNGNNTVHNQEAKLRLKLKLSSCSTRICNIGAAYSANTDTLMGQRISRIIKPQNGARDNTEKEQTDIHALYSQPIHVSQKQKPTKNTVAVPAPLIAPKPPKVKNVQLNGDIQYDVPSRRRSTGTSVDIGDYIPYRPAEEQYAATRGLVRVYLSERQSGTIKLHGQLHPGAPPATPTPGEYWTLCLERKACIALTVPSLV